MSIFNTINNLKSNILGRGHTGVTTSVARESHIEMANRSPTSKLDKDPMAFSSLSYPRDLVNDNTNGHYMLFYVNVQNKTKFPYTRASDGIDVPPTIVKDVKEEIVSTDTSGRSPNSKTEVRYTGEEEISGGFDPSDIPPKILKALKKKQTILYGDVTNIRKDKNKMRTGLSRTWNPTVRITDSVAIYLPPNVQDSYTTTYKTPATGLIGFLAASAGGAVQAYKDNDFDQVARTILETGGGMFEELAKNVGSSALEMLTQSEGGYELLNKTFGRATNPYMEVLFSGPELRQFTYNFTFAPRNAAEQDEVKKIIHLFRFYQAPELRPGNSLFMGLPAEFDIYYMYQHEDGRTSKENDYYNKISTCVLQNVSVDYTPGEVRSHKEDPDLQGNGGAPVIIKMSLQFQEMEMITKDHIEAGY